MTLNPGVPITLGAPVSTPLTAVYALAWVDATTLEVTNAAAVWHEPAFEDAGPAPASYDPPRDDTRRGRRQLGLGRCLRVEAERVELAPARAPLAWEELELEGSGRRTLPAGDRLRWEQGRLTVDNRRPLRGHAAAGGRARRARAGRSLGLL